jgi:outer membrane protein assembly factor BamE (lipoprotein component of BamABCDE complex)
VQNNKRSNALRAIFAGLAALVCAGCVSSGTQVSEATASQFKEGVTTERDVIRVLGEPQQTTVMQNHHRLLVYVGISAHATAATYVPVVGLFAGGAKGTHSTATFDFDQNGILTSMSHSTGQTDVRSGLLNQGSTK